MEGPDRYLDLLGIHGIWTLFMKILLHSKYTGGGLPDGLHPRDPK